MREVLDEAARGPIVCVGDIDVDLIIGVPHVPGSDEKVTGRLIQRGPGGMMANAAVALARLGTPVRLVTAAGDDADGAYLAAALRAEGVDPAGIRRKPGVATFTCVVLVAPSGEKSLIRVASPAYLPTANDLAASDFDGASHVHTTIGDAGLAGAALENAEARGLSTSLDLEAADIPDDPEVLRGVLAKVDYLFMGQKAAAVAAAMIGPGVARGRRLTLTTLGAAGCRAEGDGDVLTQRGIPVTPRDTTGAGDAFAAAFLHQHLHGTPLARALAFANAAAALATQAFGAQAALPTVAEVERLLSETGESNA